MRYSCTLTLSFNTNVQSFFLMSSYLHSQQLQIFCRASTFTLVFSHLIFHFSRGLIVRHVQQISSFDASTRQKCQKNFLISAVSGCRSLSSFSQNYVKVCDYKKSVSSVVGVSRGKRGRGFRAGGLEHTSNYYQNCFSYYYCHSCYFCYYYHYIIRWTCTHTQELASTKSP